MANYCRAVTKSLRGTLALLPFPMPVAVLSELHRQYTQYECCFAHRTFCYFELCSICLREGLGRSKPATNPWNKHNNTTVGISTIFKTYWTVFYRINEHYKCEWVRLFILDNVESAYNSARSRCWRSFHGGLRQSLNYVKSYMCREGYFLLPFNEYAIAQGPKIQQKNEL